MKYILVIYCLLSYTLHASAQSYEEKDIKSFGATGDGLHSDHDAFVKAAAYFNARGGHGKLVISNGTYIVGKQTFSKGTKGQPCYFGEDVLHLKGVRDFTIEGKNGAKIKYMNGLKFGAFNPATGEIFDHGNNYFVNYSYSSFIGMCIYIDKCTNVTVTSLELNGNSDNIILGGVYGDVGRQLPHYGVFISNSKIITIDNINCHHFGLDGICIGNAASDSTNNILLQNCTFEYNSRQGLSWIGGKGLTAKYCKFNHTGQGKFSSAPGSGVDIEAEWSPIRNGRFENCEFIDNKITGLVADSGNSGECSFSDCTFWGIDGWSIWIKKPAFSFKGCTIYGSVVHGYDASNDYEATRFTDCYFEDKPLNGRQAFGTYLVESSGMKRVNFTNCRFVSNTKKLLWVQTKAVANDEKYQFNNCTFTMNNSNLPKGDFIAIIRGIRSKNCKLIMSKEADVAGYYLSSCCEYVNVDAGGNKSFNSQ